MAVPFGIVLNALSCFSICNKLRVAQNAPIGLAASMVRISFIMSLYPSLPIEVSAGFNVK